MCMEGDGDCNIDNDCAGILQCGHNNCLSFHPAGGGLWDAEDDCCERRCTPQHPCKEGEGQCLTNADCLNSGWAKCGIGKCLNRTYFPINTFIFNTQTFGYSAKDGCCYRACNKNYHLCGLNETGCQADEDCLPGLYCKTDVAQPFCTDLNECDPSNGVTPGYLVCGDNAVCVNTIGSFNCSCTPGYQNYIPWEGCSDINECASFLTFNCTLYAQCFNVPGNYTCKCKIGYQGDPSVECYDIDECKDPTLNTCNGGLTPYGFNTETFGGENVKYFKIKKNPDLFSIKVLFELSTPEGALFRLCQNRDTESCYLLAVGATSNTKFYLAKNNIIMTFINHTTNHNLAVDMSNFKTFWMKILLQAGTTLLIQAGSANDSASINFTDTTNLLSVGYIGLSTNTSGRTAFWRNVRVGTSQQSCLNNYGSFICVDIENDEYLGIGTGGSLGSSYLGKPVVITRDMISCSNSRLASLGSKVSHGTATLDNWLFVCGGQSSFRSSASTSCMKYDMDNNTGVWLTSTSLPSQRQDFGMLSLNGYIYAMGGRNSYNYDASIFSDVYRLSLASNVWSPRAAMPMPTFSQCVVSEEDSDVIWSIGGYASVSYYSWGTTSNVYNYNVTSNKWFLHSNLNYTTAYSACGLITLKTGWKRLFVALGDSSTSTNLIQYWSFYSNTGWYTTTILPLQGQKGMWMLSLTPYTLVAVAGSTTALDESERNFFNFNLDTYSFESGWNYLISEMKGSAWIKVKRSYRALANCVSIIKYAAVGWGGGATSTPVSYTTQWDVLLRSRSTSHMWEPSSPVRCDDAIPDLSPGKYTPGITSVGYLLIVCGGNQYGKAVESTCMSLDTNQDNATWTNMQSMPVARGDFPLVTYGDAVFAIGGAGSNGSLKQVDRWTQTLGWVTVAPYPGLGLSQHCAVADEGYDKIYSLGSYRCSGKTCNKYAEAYQYIVSNNTWATFPSLASAAACIGCAIVRRGGTGNRMIIISGNSVQTVQYFDLVSGTSWGTLPNYEYYGWNRPKLVSVTPWEVYRMGGYCSSCGYG